MLPHTDTPLIRLSNLFPDREIYAKCEFAAPSGCFKIRGAVHLLERLVREGGPRRLVVPSMGNTALGAAVAARKYGFEMIGVVPVSISPDKDEKLRALGAELIKLEGGGSELLSRAADIARERGGYCVHPHLDAHWTDGYQSIASEILAQLPACRSIVIPVGGGGLLLGMLAHLRASRSEVKLVGREPYSYPKYAAFSHERSTTIADGLRLERPHPTVLEAIESAQIEIGLVSETEIRAAMRELFEKQGLLVEPSSAIAAACAGARGAELDTPLCVVLTGQNIGIEQHCALISSCD